MGLTYWDVYRTLADTFTFPAPRVQTGIRTTVDSADAKEEGRLCPQLSGDIVFRL